MSLLTGFRNLIGRKREPRTGVAVVAEIEAKPPEPEFRPGLAEQDDDRVIVETARKAAEQFVRQLDGHIEASLGRTEEIVRRLDAHVGLQADQSKQLADQLGQVLDLGGEIAQIKQQCASLLERIDGQLDRSWNHDEVIDAAVGAAVEAAEARFGEALDRHGESLRQMRAQLDSTARSVSQSGERSEGLAHALRDIQERTAGLDDAITRIGRTVLQREDEVVELLRKTRRSMTLFFYGCTFVAVVAVGIAVVAILLR